MIAIPNLRERGTVAVTQETVTLELSDFEACSLVADVVAKLPAITRGRLLAQLDRSHRRAAENNGER